VSCHSIEVAMCPEEITPRWEDRASQRMKIKKSKAAKDSIEPILDTTFHFV